MDEKIKEIAEFWLNFEFLKKFKELGDKYSELIKQEKNNGEKWHVNTIKVSE